MNKEAIKKGIRKRIIFAFILCFILMTLVGYLLLGNVMTLLVSQSETVNAQDTVQKIQKEFNEQTASLSLLAAGWNRNDAVQFIQDKNEQFLQDSLSDSYLANLNIDTILFSDASGKMVYARQFDRQNGKSADADPAIKQDLSKLGMLNNANPDKKIQGLLNLARGPLMIASSPVTVDQKGTVAGNVFVGRYLDRALLNEIAPDYNPVADPIDSQSYKALQQSGGQPPIQVIPQDDNTLLGVVYIPDLFGQSAVRIRAVLPQNIQNIGQNISVINLVILALIFVVNLALLIGMLDSVVLNRLTKLHRDVTTIAKSREFNKRVIVSNRQDEISELSGGVNGMLDVMQELHNTVKEQNNDLETKVEQRTQELLDSNKELTQEKEFIKHIAYHDNLTGLPNSSYLNIFLDYQIAFSNRLEKPLAVLFMDLDGFKMINDSLGHAAGDQLLMQVSERLNAIFRKSDFIARIGGDEFVIVINAINQIGTVDMTAGKVLESLVKPFVINGQECFITASIGISLYPADGKDSQELLKNADLAMYKAKYNGRNQYCYCTQEMKNTVVENMVTCNQLWRALDKNEFELYYQPQISCSTGEITGMEALIRWNHSERGMVMPGYFVSLAEQTGAIVPIGKWLLETACRQCRAWQQKYSIRTRIAVNMSVKQLMNNNIVTNVKNILKETGLDPSCLELEITESVVMKEIDQVLEILNALKALGVIISIDDFGTEYASMNYLKMLPIDKIKIAMQFIQNLDTSEKDQAITKAIIILAKNMGLSVIAEGVETESQLNFLIRESCDETQGFYFYKPMPAEQMEKALQNHRRYEPRPDAPKQEKTFESRVSRSHRPLED